MPTINERMTAAGVPGRPYTIAAQLDWAAAELDRLESKFQWCLKNYVLPLVEDMEKGETE